MSVNLFGDEWDGGRDRPGWEWKRLGVGERLRAEKIGASLFELAPRQRTFPYHWQAVQEEWLIVLAGRPTLRDPPANVSSSPAPVSSSSAARRALTRSATTPTSRRDC
jgi:hypothetical protein